MSEERDGQIYERRTTFSYLLRLILGSAFILLYIWSTINLLEFDPIYKIILLLVSVILAAIALLFTYINANILRSILKVVTGILALVQFILSVVFTGLTGLVMSIWFGFTVFLLFSTFKWLRETEVGGQASVHIRKFFSYYLCMLCGIIFLYLYMWFVLSIMFIDPFYKMILMDISILLVATSLGFAYMKTRPKRLLMTVISGSLAGIHGYLSLALFTGAGVYMFGWFGFALLLIYASFNWLKE
ncbi:MAG: hypothetical protein ACTSU3_10185 [Candidatus Thorarchaeota archaeon]